LGILALRFRAHPLFAKLTLIRTASGARSFDRHFMFAQALCFKDSPPFVEIIAPRAQARPAARQQLPSVSR